MTATTTSSASDSNDLQATVTATGTTTPTGTDIAPEHKHHADAILAMDHMQVPMPYDIPEGHWANLTLRATALPPAMQREVADKLAAFGPLSTEAAKAKEAELTADAIRSQRSRNIVKLGVGKDATPYHRELAAIAREVDDLMRDHDNIQGELERVEGYRTEVDPETGEPKPVKVYAVTGTKAKAYVERQQDILRQVRLLVGDDNGPGIEGARRVREALVESVAARVELERQLTEEAEAKALAAKINRDKRISARAESLASLQRNGG